jgi:hypothetical protein
VASGLTVVADATTSSVTLPAKEFMLELSGVVCGETGQPRTYYFAFEDEASLDSASILLSQRSPLKRTHSQPVAILSSELYSEADRETPLSRSLAPGLAGTTAASLQDLVATCDLESSSPPPTVPQRAAAAAGSSTHSQQRAVADTQSSERVYGTRGPRDEFGRLIVDMPSGPAHATASSAEGPMGRDVKSGTLTSLSSLGGSVTYERPELVDMENPFGVIDDAVRGLIRTATMAHLQALREEDEPGSDAFGGDAERQLAAVRVRVHVNVQVFGGCHAWIKTFHSFFLSLSLAPNSFSLLSASLPSTTRQASKPSVAATCGRSAV